MKASALRKADLIAKARAPKPRMHFFWWDRHETRADVRARIRAKITSGEASRYDRFVIFTWTREEGEGGGDPPWGGFDWTRAEGDGAGDCHAPRRRGTQ